MRRRRFGRGAACAARLHRLFFLVAFVLCLAVAPAAHATSIVVNNTDGAGEGFNDATPRSPEGGNPGTTTGSGPEFGTVDKFGNVFAGEPRPRVLRKYVKVR